MSKTVLVVAAHPDDEALGCGGTIVRHVDAGDRVHLVFITDGVSGRVGANEEDLFRRTSASEEAGKILGIRTTSFLGFPDSRLDSVPLLDIIQSLESILARISPQIIYTHHCGDLNVDHRIAHAAVMTACRPLPGNSVEEILTFEVMSSTEWSGGGGPSFIPNLFVDITDQLETKMQALQAYGLEMRPFPHSRSLEHLRCLAQHRGCCVGIEAAEAFVIARQIR